MAKKQEKKNNSIALNKKARFDYFIEERIEAGLALQGWEVKSMRAGKAQITESYVTIRDGEAWLLGSHLTPLNAASTHVQAEPTRPRKLLLTRHEIDRLTGLVERKGYTLVALELYWSKNHAKLAVGLSPIDVAFGISWLEEQGFVVEASEPHALQGFADALGITPLGDRAVKLVKVGDVPVEPLEASLRALGVRLGDGGLTVVVTDDYLHLKHFEGPWMPVKPVGTVLWIGPLFDPQPRGCWHCLAERIRACTGWRASSRSPTRRARAASCATGATCGTRASSCSAPPRSSRSSSAASRRSTGRWRPCVAPLGEGTVRCCAASIAGRPLCRSTWR